MRKIYNVSYRNRDVYQALLAEASSEEDILTWFYYEKPKATVLGISEAKTDDMKPGKPYIEVIPGHAAIRFALRHLTSILQREKGMVCTLLIPDERQARVINSPIGRGVLPGETYVVITCENSHKYYLNVTGDSVMGMCYDIMKFLINK